MLILRFPQFTEGICARAVMSARSSARFDEKLARKARTILNSLTYTKGRLKQMKGEQEYYANMDVYRMQNRIYR